MAATLITNLTLSPENEYCTFIDCCSHVGAYVVIINCENPEGSHAIFHMASAYDGQKKVDKRVGVAGSNGEQVHIVWPTDGCPVLCYESDEHALAEARHYNLKII